jgi:hypothetical protein
VWQSAGEELGVDGCGEDAAYKVASEARHGAAGRNVGIVEPEEVAKFRLTGR